MSNKGHKTHIRIDKELSNILSKWIGCQRFIYNAKVEESNYFFRFKKHQLDLTGINIQIDQQYSQFKTELTPWLSEIPSQILRNGSYKFMLANKRFLNKLSGKPKKQKKSIKESVMITNELFRFDDKNNLILETKSKYFGTIKLNNKTRLILQQYNIPKTIYISRKTGSWYLSLAYEDNTYQQTEQELLDYIKQHTVKELESRTIGIDRGVRVNTYLSDGNNFEYGEKLNSDFNILDKKIKSAQRKLAKKKSLRKDLCNKSSDGVSKMTTNKEQTKYSSNYNKQKLKLQKLHKKVKNKRTNFNHHVSKAIVLGGDVVENSNTIKYEPCVRLDKILLIGFENLKLKNMTKKASASFSEKKNQEGLAKDADKKITKGTIKNLGKNVKQKSGLNKAILHNNLGQVKLFTKYKALNNGILVVDVDAKYSSQECHKCGFVHAENRKDSLFSCLNCKHTTNADFNASMVIKKRTISKALSDSYMVKKVKKIGFRKKSIINNMDSITVGLEQSNLLPVETLLDTVGENIYVDSINSINTYSAEVDETGSLTL